MSDLRLIANVLLWVGFLAGQIGALGAAIHHDPVDGIFSEMISAVNLLCWLTVLR